MSLDMVFLDDPHVPVKGTRRRKGRKRRRQHRTGQVVHTTQDGRGTVGRLRRQRRP
jgi:hypothetical protein